MKKVEKVKIKRTRGEEEGRTFQMMKALCCNYHVYLSRVLIWPYDLQNSVHMAGVHF